MWGLFSYPTGDINTYIRPVRADVATKSLWSLALVCFWMKHLSSRQSVCSQSADRGLHYIWPAHSDRTQIFVWHGKSERQISSSVVWKVLLRKPLPNAAVPSSLWSHSPLPAADTARAPLVNSGATRQPERPTHFLSVLIDRALLLNMWTWDFLLWQNNMGIPGCLQPH